MVKEGEHEKNGDFEDTEKLQPTKPSGSIDDVYPQTANVSAYVVVAPPTPAASSAPPQDAPKATPSPVQYVPTPIAQIALARRRHKMASSQSSQNAGRKTPTPMYIPTPLSQIAAQPESNSSSSQKYQLTKSPEKSWDETEYDPTSTSLMGYSKSDKYSLDHKLHAPAGENEYDPLENGSLFTVSKQKAPSPETSPQRGQPVGGSKGISDECNHKPTQSSSLGEQTVESGGASAKAEKDEDGLYDFDDLEENVGDDCTDEVDEYSPLPDHDDDTLSPHVSAKYTPTKKYSISTLHSEPGNDSEYDPCSNFSSGESLRKQHEQEKRKELSREEESSDSDALVIDDKADNKRKASSSEDEPAQKKQKCSSDEDNTVLESGRCLTDEGVCRDWLSDGAQENFLAATSVNFDPPSDPVGSFNPSYSYNPSETHSGKEKCDSGSEELNPMAYLTEISKATDDKCTKERPKPKMSQAVKEMVSQDRKARFQEIKGGSSKSKALGEAKQKSVTKKSVETPKHKDSTDEKQTCTSKTEQKQGKVLKQKSTNGAKGEPQVGEYNSNDGEVSPKSRPAVSSDQLSSFFKRMNEQKSKKAKVKSSHETYQPQNKEISKKTDHDAETKKSKVLAGHKNTFPKLPRKAGTVGNKVAGSTGKEDASSIAGSQDLPKSDDVIVIDSSSSSDDCLPQLGSQSTMANGASEESGTCSFTGKQIFAAKVSNRKASTKLLFGDDSDSDSSDVQIVQRSEDEIMLISDGYSSTDGKQITQQTKHHSTDKQGKPTSAVKQQKNSHTVKKPSTNAHSSKPVADRTPSQSHQGAKSVRLDHSKQDSSYQAVKGRLSVKVNIGNSSQSQTVPSVKKRQPQSPFRSEEGNSVVAMDYGVESVSTSDYEEDAELSDDFDINDVELSFSESDTFEECLRIFQEESSKVPVKKPREPQKLKEKQLKTEDLLLSTGKQRVAHSSKFQSAQAKYRKCTPRPKARPTPLQVCHNRYMQAQQQLRQQWQNGPTQQVKDSPAGSKPSGSAGKRIAHVPSSSKPSSLPKSPASSSQPAMGVNARIQLKYSIGHGAGSNTGRKTVAITAPKGERRVAHLPKKVNPRPIIPPDSANKVPSSVRQRYLNLFIDEFLKTTQTEQDAFDQGLKEEKSVYDRATSRNIYLNLSINTLKRLRSAQAPGQSKPASPGKASISHEAIIGGKPATQHTYTLNRSLHSRLASQEEKYEGAFLYKKLKPYLLSEEELVANRYPRPSDTPGHATVREDDTKKCTSADPNQRFCSRCGKTFLRRPDGHYITRESCTYHWGKFWHKKVGGSFEGRFNCCSGTSDAKGCCIAKYHVTEDKTSNLTGFMRTVAKSPPADGNAGLYSLDCEMCYTVKGLELTRVTVIDDKLDCVYDSLVKPSNEIVDYNTRFSGITEDDLKSATTTLQDVQAILLSMFSSDTILIGHSLESDMLALKMIHSTIIDTAVLFPHKRGLPFKRALRTLMAECLSRIIQNDVGGHDSKEDAKSCMELIIWKAKQDAKKTL
ncbi:RNA exonuclease 1 homolog isoform X2 [Acanthaster planci]|uniref:RNA exonuclease 1 homolog isoform X2 n=1 Tax=Acanthaster planci TaxID=133434 RepID=A0A8B7Y3W6_ACAPL|nr:RNA exonuclease 1 homolog isoform X2 [Acanthaster planci]